MFSMPVTKSGRLSKVLKLMTELADELYLMTAARVLFGAIGNCPTTDLMKSFCCLKTVGVTSSDESNRKIRSALEISAVCFPRRK